MPQKLMTPSQRTVFFNKLEELYPNPKAELEFKSDFTLLVAIILSAQSTDKQVNKVTDSLFAVAKTPQEIADMGLDKLTQYIKSINYYNNKAKSIFNLSKILVKKYDSKIPKDFDTLLTLPGVGRKTANVFLNIALDAPTLGVDTHVLRLCKRLKICNGSTPEKVEKELEKIVPKNYMNRVSLALVLHGRYICKAINPKCGECGLYDVCLYENKKPKVKKANR
ncbi:MAG: endonuclease III [Lactobacillales bacterium]|jgi:endonuclease-3|nr:endonuclease III [Lactobacillales bacterium]